MIKRINGYNYDTDRYGGTLEGKYTDEDNIKCSQCSKPLSSLHPMYSTNTRDTYLCTSTDCLVGHRDDNHEFIEYVCGVTIIYCDDCDMEIVNSREGADDTYFEKAKKQEEDYGCCLECFEEYKTED